MNFYLAKIFTAFFLPPGIFIIILILGAFFARKFKFLFALSAIIMYLLSITPISNALLSPLENFKHKDNITPKAVVVLGGGANPKDILKASPDGFKREIYGLILAKKYNLPLIISGGGFSKEANLYKKDLNLIEKICKCKIPIFLEQNSFNTYQNAKYTAKLFKTLGLKKEIYLVTSAYHMKRAVILFKKFGFKIITKPVDFKTTPINSILDFLPKEGSFHKSYKAIHEYIGILRAKLR